MLFRFIEHLNLQRQDRIFRWKFSTSKEIWMKDAVIIIRNTYLDFLEKIGKYSKQYTKQKGNIYAKHFEFIKIYYFIHVFPNNFIPI